MTRDAASPTTRQLKVEVPSWVCWQDPPIAKDGKESVTLRCSDGESTVGTFAWCSASKPAGVAILHLSKDGKESDLGVACTVVR